MNQYPLIKKYVGVRSFSIASFNPLEQKKLSSEYAEGHHQVLVDHGIEQKIRSADRDWCNDANVIGLGLFCGGKMIGGVKIHRGGLSDLPLASSVGNLELQWVQKALSDSRIVGELCGLWVAQEYLKKGLSEVLVRAGVAKWLMLGEGTLLTFASQYTLTMTIDLGFEIIALGEGKMWLPYPSDDFKSYVLSFVPLDGYVKSVHRSVLAQLASKHGTVLISESDYTVSYEL